MIRAGELRDRVTIERPVETQRPSGSVEVAYEPWLERIAAAVQPITGQERWLQTQVASESTARIRIRYRDGLTARMRVRHHVDPGSPTLDDIYDVEAVIAPDGRRVEIQLLCRKRDAEGFRSDNG